jgi:hypothetical protein
MGFASSSISKMRSRLSIRGRSAGGGGWRGHTPRSARDLPGPSTRPGANLAAPGARAEIPRGARKWPSPSAPCRCRGEAGAGVAEVEPPPLPVHVVGGHRAGDVLLPARAPQRERQATGARCVANLRLRRS